MIFDLEKRLLLDGGGRRVTGFSFPLGDIFRLCVHPCPAVPGADVELTLKAPGHLAGKPIFTAAAAVGDDGAARLERRVSTDELYELLGIGGDTEKDQAVLEGELKAVLSNGEQVTSQVFEFRVRNNIARPGEGPDGSAYPPANRLVTADTVVAVVAGQVGEAVPAEVARVVPGVVAEQVGGAVPAEVARVVPGVVAEQVGEAVPDEVAKVVPGVVAEQVSAISADFLEQAAGSAAAAAGSAEAAEKSAEAAGQDAEDAEKILETIKGLDGDYMRKSTDQVVSGKKVFTQSAGVGSAVLQGEAAQWGQVLRHGEFFDETGTDWLRIPIEAAIMAGAILPADKTGFAHMSAPAGLASITYYGRAFYTPASVVASSEANCYKRITGRQVIGLVTSGSNRKAVGFLACPLKAATSGAGENTWQDGTAAFDYAGFFDQGSEGLRGSLILIGVSPESMPGFCNYPTIAAGSSFDDAYMEGVYDALPHDYSYIALSIGMTGGATVRSHAFYINADAGKAVYLGKVSWPRNMIGGERLFISVKKNEVGNVVFRVGRIDRYSFMTTTVISEFITDLTDLGGDFLAFTNAGMLSVANMFYKKNAL